MKIFSKIKMEKIFSNSISKWQIKLLFILGAFIIFLFSIFYTRAIVSEIIEREKNMINSYANVNRRYSDPTANIKETIFLFDNITPNITFPVIMTNENDIPIKSGEQFFILNIELDSTKSDNDKMAYLKNYVTKMGENYSPIVIKVEKDNRVNYTKFYYIHSDLVDKLQLFPFVVIISVTMFVVIGYLAFSNIRRSEESKVWIGMAKEAAHQLGTPLSSLLAWIEILRYNKEDPGSVDDTIKEMENDVLRLNTIARRFSKIGSKPDKSIENISEVTENVCQYFEKRLPHLGRRVDIKRNLQENIRADISEDLFQWVIENLLKNAAEAIENKHGTVFLILVRNRKRIIITVKDNGKGMTAKQKRQIFHPGFTTKKRGWGLGLSLCKRIIEQYHDGRIYVKDTLVGKGTTFVIELPVPDEVSKV
ncbi:MAG: histidine kinase [Bacteroidota bacterium]|nr:histidine kinase [Bacteroidota bacterium]